MSKTIKLGDGRNGLTLPLDCILQTIAIVAKRRVGKSYLARRFAEQIHKAGEQLIIIDPKGDWWGIASSRDGKSAGLPLVIFGGDRGHVPLEPSSGEIVAKLLVEQRVSAVIDLSLMRKGEVATFSAIFLETLYRLKSREQYRTPCMLIIDEGDAIAPQRPQPNEARMLGAAEDIVRRGGQRGLGCIVITQRAAVLNKNVLTQAQILIALRTIAPQDLAAMQAWIDVHGDREQRKTLMESLPSLPVGDSWVWSPGWPTTEGIFERMHTAPIETFDSGATPKPGERRVEPKTVAEVDLDAVRAHMAETLERAKLDDPKALRAELARRETRIGELQRQLEHAPKPKPEIKRVEVPAISAKDRAALERLGGRLEALAGKLGPLLDEWKAESASAMQLANAVMIALRKADPPAAVRVEGPGTRLSSTGPQTSEPERPVAARAVVKALRRTPSTSSNGHAASLGKGELETLGAIAQTDGGASRALLTTMLGFKRSYRDLLLQKLRRAGLIEDGAEGRIVATAAGAAALPSDFEPLPSGDRLREHWLSEGSLPSGERAVLELACAEYPKAVSRDAISEVTGFKRSYRDLVIQKLGRRLLVSNGKDGVRASEALFG